MSIIRIGATKKYASNWSSAFGQKPSAKARTEKAAPESRKKTPKKKSAPAKSK